MKTNKLVIIRGLPGSGKSTLARKMINAHPNKKIFHFEADMYFETKNGYEFDPSKLGAAHNWCISRTKEELLKGNDVIVSNTFTTHKELEPYITFAKQNNIPYSIIEAKGNYTSVHNVPEDAMERMRKRWEKID